MSSGAYWLIVALVAGYAALAHRRLVQLADIVKAERKKDETE